MSVMVGSVTESLAPDEDFPAVSNVTVNLLDASNFTVNETARDAVRVQLASTLGVLVGLFQVPQVPIALLGAHLLCPLPLFTIRTHPPFPLPPLSDPTCPGAHPL